MTYIAAKREFKHCIIGRRRTFLGIKTRQALPSIQPETKERHTSESARYQSAKCNIDLMAAQRKILFLQIQNGPLSSCQSSDQANMMPGAATGKLPSRSLIESTHNDSFRRQGRLPVTGN